MIVAVTAVAIASELDRILDTSRDGLLAISDQAAGARPGPDQWSKKEILGHLIDSASNNHQRFVRLQIGDELVFPAYQQNDWVRTQAYPGRPWRELVEFWLMYNRHMAHVMRHADARAAGHVWKASGGDVDLQFLMEDYLSHLRHHLHQILATAE
jgi:hypothetical protein